MTPQVAVVMAAFNAEKTILQAANSLLQGTHPCKIYIVDDCSRTPVRQTLGEYDPDQIEIIELERNSGPAAARNAALKQIIQNCHQFVAIMDADDVSHPERLAKQVAYLLTHPEIALVGCWERMIEEHSGNVISYVSLPCEPEAIRNSLYFNMCVPHPTWLLRTSVLKKVGLYSLSYPAAEDYEFLRRIVARFDVANLSEYLLDYRVSSGGMSMRHRTRQLFDRLRIQANHFNPLNWRAPVGMLRTLVLLILRIRQEPAKAAGLT